MRAKLLGLVVGLSLVAASAAPSLACDYHQTSASSDQTQQTASADNSAQPQLTNQ